MKTKIIFLLLTCWVVVAWGQKNGIKKDGNYEFDYISIDALKNLKNNSSLEKSVTLEKVKEKIMGSRYRVTVKKLENNQVYFTFWKFEKSLNKIINNTDDTVNEDKRIEYVMSLKDFEENTSPVYNRVDWRAGFFTTPFKLRFNDFTFDANVNLGVNIGAKIRINRSFENGFALEPIFGFGLASIKIDNTNSNVGEPINLSAFSVNGGVLFHITKDIKDFIVRERLTNYSYNNRTWGNFNRPINAGDADLFEAVHRTTFKSPAQ